MFKSLAPVACALGVVISLTIVIGSGGCEVVVSGGMPSVIACIDRPSACPPGQACINGTCTPCAGATCRAQGDSGGDVIAADDVVLPPPDSSENSDAVRAGSALGANCATSSNCKSGICGDAAVLTSDVLLQTPMQQPVCTKPCCTSTDCDDPDTPGFVCYESIGGRYCVDPSWVARASVGAALAGDACATASDCRSGVCTKSKCHDTCCANANCGNGTVCNFTNLGPRDGYACSDHPSSSDSLCAWQANGTSGDYCYQASNCQSAMCLSIGTTDACNRCVGPCCKDSDCPPVAGGGMAVCAWNQLTPSNDVFLGCTLPLGTKLYGEACSADTDCASSACNTLVGKCTEACCGDADCRGNGLSWLCRPKPVTLPGGTVDILLCEPP